MIYNVYWVSSQYPFNVLISEADTESDDADGYAETEWVGKSAIKAEIISYSKLIEYINENNDYNGIKIFSSMYVNSLKKDLDGIIDAYPEEAI